MLAIGFLGVLISRSIGGPLSNAVSKITRLARGDLDIPAADAGEKSELGEVDKALDVLRANAVEQQALQEKVREQNVRLRESEQRLHFSLLAGEAGSFELSLDTLKIVACDQALMLLHIPLGTPLTLRASWSASIATIYLHSISLSRVRLMKGQLLV